MRRRLNQSLLVALAATAFCVTTLAAPQASSVTEQLTQIEHRLAKAGVDRDLDYFNSILAPDWITIDLTGRVLTRSQVFEELSSLERKIESAAIDDIRVREYGEVAIVTGRTTATGSYKGQRMTVVLRFTDIFVRRDGRWQVVASQGTQVAK
jgi:ketosteroid isomerase-like protein